MLTQLAGVVLAEAAAHEEAAPLIAPPLVIGGCMLAFLLLLMFVCVSFMNLGNRHDAVEAHEDPQRQFADNHGHHDDSVTGNH